MQFRTLVRPEHLNQHGRLFGGYMLHWVDEYAYIAAIEDHPGCRLVTRAMDAVSFTRGVECGALLTFDVTPLRRGSSSVTYRVSVSARNQDGRDAGEVFNTCVTLCAIDEAGKKTPLP